MKDENFNGIDDTTEAMQMHAQESADLGPGFLDNSPPEMETEGVLSRFDGMQPAQNQMIPAQGPQTPMQQPAPVQAPQQLGMPNPFANAVALPQEQMQAAAPMLQSNLSPQAANPFAGPSSLLAQGMANEEAGIKLAGNTQAQAAQAQEKAYAQLVEQQAKVQAAFEQSRQQLEAERAQLFDAVQNQKIDPNRMWSNMSTGNKVLAAISMVFGGIGAGMQGPNAKNLAIENIERAIDRDIEAQKMELGKKQNLLSENLRRFGDLNTATQATMLQLNTVTQAKIAQIAAKFGAPQAKATELMLMGQLKEKAAGLASAIAEKQAAARIMQGGAISDADVMGLDEKIRERLVKVNGQFVPAFDRESAKEARKIVAANDAMISNLDELTALRDKYGAEKLPGPVKARMQTLATTIQLAMKEANQLGTLDKGAEKFMEKLVADPTSIGFVADQYRAVKETQLRTAQNKLKALGVNANYMQATPQPVERFDQRTGRVALFDPATKKFMGYKQ